MDAPTYVQRIARNHLQNMVPCPDHLDIADEYRGGQPADRLHNGLASLHKWLARVYAGAADSPQDFGLPLHPDLLPRSGSKYTASAAAFGSIPRLIFALGLFGVPDQRNERVSMRIDGARLAAYCIRAKIKKAQALLGALGEYRLELAPGSDSSAQLDARFANAPDIALALPAFVRACGALTAQETQPPVEFYRVDMRVMQATPSPKRSLAVTVADASRPLDEDQAGVLTELDRLVELLGFRAEVKRSGLNRGEWRGSYRNSRLGRTLFGFVVEEGRLAVRIMIGETSRILPYLERCPLSMREAFSAAHSCQKCGKCQVGPVHVSLDGAPRRLCNYALFTIPNVETEWVEGIRILLRGQAEILQASA